MAVGYRSIADGSQSMTVGYRSRKRGYRFISACDESMAACNQSIAVGSRFLAVFSRFLASGVAFIFLESPVFLDRGGSIQRGEDTLVTDADKSVHGATTTPAFRTGRRRAADLERPPQQRHHERRPSQRGRRSLRLVEHR